jgi:hypothetical protein
MLALALGSLVASVLVAYAVGYAFVAARGTFFRTKKGVWLLVVLALSFLPLPPQVAALDSANLPLSDVLGEAAASSIAWPEGFGKTTFLVVWAASTVLAFLAGIRIWQAGSPEWRGSGGQLYDASAVSRVNSLLMMAESLDDAIDTIGRAGLSARDARGVANEVRKAGKTFAEELPAKAGDVYALVARKMPSEVASVITGYLLEGAGRRGGGS